MAARMVDAQAPALAPRIQEVLELMASDTARHADVIERLGLLQLVVEGVARRNQLSPARQADLRTVLGWPPDKDDVIATGEAVADVWRVIGQTSVERDAKLSERRVWLRGVKSGRYALLLDFAYAGRGWEQGWRHDGHYSAVLRFYPGSVPLRALAIDVQPAAAEPESACGSVEAAIESASHAFACNPWLAQWPLIVADAVFGRQGNDWHVRTTAGVFPVAIEDAAAWGLMAFGGGHPINLMGEWDGRAQRVLSAVDKQGGQWTLEFGA